jgi:hypothetical protein
MNRLAASSNVATRMGAFAGVLLATIAVSLPAWAAPIQVTFRDALEAGGTPVGLPFLLSNSPRNVFLRFNLPDFQNILSVNSIDVTVRLYDDGDGATESGDILFAVRAPDTDFSIGSVGAPLDGTTQGAPLVFTHSLTPAEIGMALPTLTDNDAFRIRVNRTSGDFFVLDGSVLIDAELKPVPEPGSLLFVGIGLTGLLWARARRPRLPS